MPSIDVVERQYDCFISYAPADGPKIKLLRRRLRLGPEPRIDPGFQGKLCERIPVEPPASTPIEWTDEELAEMVADGRGSAQDLLMLQTMSDVSTILREASAAVLEVGGNDRAPIVRLCERAVFRLQNLVDEIKH